MSKSSGVYLNSGCLPRAGKVLVHLRFLVDYVGNTLHAGYEKTVYFDSASSADSRFRISSREVVRGKQGRDRTLARTYPFLRFAKQGSAHLVLACSRHVWHF